MAMIVKVQWEDGKPCHGTKVTAWVNDVANREVMTNSSGEAYFDYGPGRGTIYCDGQEVISERQLSSREIITCSPSGAFSYKYS